MRNVWGVLFKTHLLLVRVLMRHVWSTGNLNTPRQVCVLTPLGVFCAWNLRLRTIAIMLAVSLFERVTGIWFQKDRTFERETAFQASCVELGLLLWDQTVNCKCSKTHRTKERLVPSYWLIALSCLRTGCWGGCLDPRARNNRMMQNIS